MGWKFDNGRLALDLKEADHWPTVMVEGSVIYVAQVGTGIRALQVHEYLAICWLLDEEPTRYIKSVDDPDTNQVFDG